MESLHDDRTIATNDFYRRLRQQNGGADHGGASGCSYRCHIELSGHCPRHQKRNQILFNKASALGIGRKRKMALALTENNDLSMSLNCFFYSIDSTD